MVALPDMMSLQPVYVNKLVTKFRYDVQSDDQVGAWD